MQDAYTTVTGNIFDHTKYHNVKIYDTFFMYRLDMAKSIQRHENKSGEVIIISIERGTALKHGDILYNKMQDRHMLIRQLPEKIIKIKIKDDHTCDKEKLFLLIGHMIGNRHRPISIKNDDVLFPIQDDSELETFTILFDHMLNDIELQVSNEIFTPHRGADVHGHQ